MTTSRRTTTIALAILVLAVTGYALFSLVARKTVIICPVSKHESQMSAIITAMRTYKGECGEYPTGSNSAVMRALRGDNAKRLVFIELNPRDISNSGEFMDPWGTPFQIITSEKEVTVRSAGPNRQFDNAPKADDIVRTGTAD